MLGLHVLVDQAAPLPPNIGLLAVRPTKLRRSGIEPGSTAWKATMLTVTPPTPGYFSRAVNLKQNSSDD